MDKRLEEKILLKIEETFSNKEDLLNTIKFLEKLSTDRHAFVYGIVIGRLYNAFYYQCRRILKREPTKPELEDFLKILKSKESEFLEKLSL